MEILGVGWQELIFIFLIALIVLGPKDMQKAGKTIGRWLNQLVRSDSWKALQQTSRELRKLPTTLMKEANVDLQETEQAIRKGLDMNPKRSVASTSDLRRSPSNETENTIQPPSVKPQSTNAQAAVPGGESSAEDGPGSKNSGNESERHD
ncbi:MAG: twin-arginine translocase TatA/TatE family subunit [Anaerolineae bacterium]|nr:twin-arginine translocase TatA/TatE family subunit [Anaerolineae bacterium]MCI0610337.1 twin-arginine translocase TatA/TatE family subunit [Anaerolineae bacterium]